VFSTNLYITRRLRLQQCTSWSSFPMQSLTMCHSTVYAALWTEKLNLLIKQCFYLNSARCQKIQHVFEVQSFGLDTGAQSFCHSFIALSIIAGPSLAGGTMALSQGRRASKRPRAPAADYCKRRNHAPVAPCNDISLFLRTTGSNLVSWLSGKSLELLPPDVRF